jgi:hypothetical protein
VAQASPKAAPILALNSVFLNFEICDIYPSNTACFIILIAHF